MPKLNKILSMQKLAEKYVDEGRKYFKKFEYAKAMKCYNMALELKPDDDNLYILRAYCKRRFKDHAGALEDFSTAIKINPKNILALNKRASYKEKLGDFNGALKDIIKTIEIDSKSIIGHSLASYYYYRLNNKKEARLMDLKAKDITPMSSMDFSFRAIEKQCDGKFSEALEDFTNSLELGLIDASCSYESRADCKEKMGKYKEAIEDYMRAIELCPHTFFYYYNYYKIAECKENLNDFEGALECYSKSIEYNKTYYRAYEKRGQLKIKLSQIEEGNVDIQKSVLLNK